MGQALYRKYRPKTLAEIVGQEHISKTLDQAIKTNNLSHAYLFSGPKGVGKTSIARILAHDINKLPYTNQGEHIDIIEIDAASNNGIDDIRDLREKVYISPTSAPYKIYIIDEVHMLSKQAFNGLLKTLEEPPAHVIFILATTEAHKLPDTIISRTQRYQFKPVDQEKVIAHLKHIAKLESIKINDDALSLIAKHGQGSFRDSIGLLDQAANYIQPITAETIGILIGLPPSNLIDQLIECLKTADTQKLTSTLSTLTNQGYTAATISSNIALILRTQLINNQQPILPIDQTLNLLANLIDVSSSTQPEAFLEICLLKAISQTSQNHHQTDLNQSTKPADSLATNQKPPAIDLKESNTEIKTQLTKDSEKNNPKLTTKTPQNNPEEAKQATNQQPKQASEQTTFDWEAVLGILKASYNTLYGVARMAQIDTNDPATLRLHFAFAFHQKRVNEAKNREIILAAIKQTTGQNWELECIVDKSLLTQPKPATEEPDLDVINSIFNGSEKINE